jgi:hypothetical protein
MSSFVLVASIGAGRATTYVVVALIGVAMLRWNRALAAFILQTNTAMLDGIRGRAPSSAAHGLSTSPTIVVILRAILVIFGAVFAIGCVVDLVLGVH